MRMRFDILTLFPNMFSSPLRESIIGKAIEKGLIQIRTVNIRDFTLDKHQVVDDTPYGGGQGMVMKEEPIARDFCLPGCDLAAMVLLDANSRFIPGVLGSDRSAEEDSFFNSLLEYPQYTRPFDFRGSGVPEVLLSGNHSAISLWRKREALKRTSLSRPDLLADAHLPQEEKRLLEEILENDSKSDC